jgi:hypothetical protein
VTEIDGIRGRRTHTFSGLGHPIDMLLIPQENVGLVRPRHALVADARGSIDTLDLATGKVVRRIAVFHPTAFATANGQLWVASAGRTTLTQLDVNDPARPRVVAHPQMGFQTAALAIDPDLAVGVDGVSKAGSFVRLDGVSLARTKVSALEGPVSQLLSGYRGLVWAAASRGRVLGVRARDGRVVSVMRVPHPARLSIVGGWLAATHAHSLTLFALGTTIRPRTTLLPGIAGDAAFAVLP